jgi:tetratricopeptide (TPR) repeat protein
MPTSWPKKLACEQPIDSRPDRTAVHLILFVALSLAIYARGLWNNFVTDDEAEVLQDLMIRSFRNIPGLFAHNVWYFAGSDTHNYYRPLKLVAYSVEYHLFGFRPAAWHVASILLHIAAVVSAYVLMRSLASCQLAFWTALWFAIHPAHVEVVAWIAGGQDALCEMALLLSVWFYHRARSGVSPNLNNVTAAVVFLAALFAKEAALTFPVVILAYDYLFRRESVRELLAAWRRYLPVTAAMGVYLAFRVHALKGFAPVTTGMQLSPKELILSVPALALKYVGMAIVPTYLSYWHTYVPIRNFGWWPLVAGGLTTGMVAAIFWLRRAQPILSFALAWFWLTLLPVLAIPKVSGNVFTERYLYVPSFGFCVFAAWGWLWFRGQARTPSARAVAFTSLAIVFALYSVVIVRRLPDWHDTLTLLEKTAQQSPESAYVNGALGYVYFQQDRYAEAQVFELRAIKADPRIWGVWMNLGAIDNALRQWAKAEDACRHGLKIYPDNPMLLNQIGLALWQEGSHDQGQAAWRRSVQLDPSDLTAHVNLATSLYQIGQLDAARDELLAGLSSNKDSRVSLDPQALYIAHFKLGDIYQLETNWQAAEQEYQEVLQLKPDLVAAQEQLEAIRARVISPQPLSGPIEGR